MSSFVEIQTPAEKRGFLNALHYNLRHPEVLWFWPIEADDVEAPPSLYAQGYSYGLGDGRLQGLLGGIIMGAICTVLVVLILTL